MPPTEQQIAKLAEWVSQIAEYLAELRRINGEPHPLLHEIYNRSRDLSIHLAGVEVKNDILPPLAITVRAEVAPDAPPRIWLITLLDAVLTSYADDCTPEELTAALWWAVETFDPRSRHPDRKEPGA